MADLYAPEGKTFLVTGGASGIGAQFVETFVKEGAKAVAILDVQVDAGTKLAERVNTAYPNKVVFVKCDITDEKNVEEAFNYVLEQFKQIDVIMNNAGTMSEKPTSWRKASYLNWRGAFHDDTGVRILTVCFGATDTPLTIGSEEKIWHKCVLNDLLSISFDVQRVESAIAAVVEMFKKGANGSIWLSIGDKPAKDITQDINAVYTQLEKIVFS